MKIIKIPKKKKGEYRTIYIPNKKQKAELRAFLPDLENKLRSFEKNGRIPFDILHGFITERSPVTNAKKHIGFAYTLSMDLENFFDSVKPEQVKGLIPEEVIARAFVDGAPRQGLPTSPMIANIAATAMDVAISRLFKKKKIDAVYTRYADDLSFSFNNYADYETLINKIPQIVSQVGFKIKKGKTRLQNAKFGNREVTGVMVGDSGITVSRTFKRKMRAAKHQKKFSIYRGMFEWSMLKMPKSIKEKTTQELTLEALEKGLNKKFPKLTIRPLEEIRNNEFILTNDLAYIFGMSDLAEGWTSCYKKGGANENAPYMIAHLKSYVAGILSDNSTNYYGLKRNLLKARCIVYETKSGHRVAAQFYGGKREELVNFLRANNIIVDWDIKKTKSLDINLQVQGYAPEISSSNLYFGVKKRVKLKNKAGRFVKVLFS